MENADQTFHVKCCTVQNILFIWVLLCYSSSVRILWFLMAIGDRSFMSQCSNSLVLYGLGFGESLEVPVDFGFSLRSEMASRLWTRPPPSPEELDWDHPFFPGEEEIHPFPWLTSLECTGWQECWSLTSYRWTLRNVGSFGLIWLQTSECDWS